MGRSATGKKLTFTDKVCCAWSPKKLLLKQGSVHNALSRPHSIYDGHHPFKSLVVLKMLVRYQAIELKLN